MSMSIVSIEIVTLKFVFNTNYIHSCNLSKNSIHIEKVRFQLFNVLFAYLLLYVTFSLNKVV